MGHGRLSALSACGGEASVVAGFIRGAGGSAISVSECGGESGAAGAAGSGGASSAFRRIGCCASGTAIALPQPGHCIEGPTVVPESETVVPQLQFKWMFSIRVAAKLSRAAAAHAGLHCFQV